MSGWALAAAFLSGLAWSGLDVTRKSLARHLAPAVAAAGLTLGLAVLFGAWTALTPSPLDIEAYLWPASISIVLTTGVQVLIIESVRRSELSRTIPLLSFTPVATALFGAIILDERPSLTQWIGIGLVFVGALGLGVSRTTERTHGRPARLTVDGGSLAMLGAALLISGAAPFDKLAIAASSTALHGFVQSVGVGVVLLVVLGYRGELMRVRGAFRDHPALIVAAILGFAALGLQFTAYRGAMVGVVETVKRVVGLAASLVAGYFVFGERITARKVVTVLLMGLGVVLILR